MGIRDKYDCRLNMCFNRWLNFIDDYRVDRRLNCKIWIINREFWYGFIDKFKFSFGLECIN